MTRYLSKGAKTGNAETFRLELLLLGANRLSLALPLLSPEGQPPPLNEFLSFLSPTGSRPMPEFCNPTVKFRISEALYL